MAISADLKREKELFERAFELASAGARADFLRAECRGDSLLQARIEALLRAAEMGESFLPGDPKTQSNAELLTERAGDRIGRYKVLEKIGQGGCGVVYVAEQEDAVRRQVALKVIKLGMDTRSVVARFNAERQALALMDHPGIAKVLDAGATETGRPYFVMELVRGKGITEYCDQNKVSLRERLALFIKVCHAVQHAHQKGIIHRDLKPSNILVTLHDGIALPKVIDFGIAKAVEGRLTDFTVHTALNQFIGTPAYMSPEQAGMSGLDIDTRSDVYSLGVLLYELLTGEPPFDNQSLLAAGLDEMRGTIRHKEPPRPSTRLNTMSQPELAAAAQKRHVEPPRLLSLVRGDLDWIVMKCIEKDRSRRYATANGLAADLQRYLNNEPVTARPQSVSYRCQKLVRRHKLVFATATAMLAALVFGLAISTWSFLRERVARRRAVHAELEQGRLLAQAQRARTNEAEERALAEQRLYESLVGEARATRIARRVGYRNEVFKLLGQAALLNVPQKDPADLRREAVACLGDFVGLKPNLLRGFPSEADVTLMRVAPNGQLAAFALEDGTLLLRQLPGGAQLGQFKGQFPIPSLSFSWRGETLFFLSLEQTQATNELEGAVVHVWSAAPDGNWSETERAALPGAFAILSSKSSELVAVANLRAGEVKLEELRTHSDVLAMKVPSLSERLPSIALSEEGTLFAIGDASGTAGRGATIAIWEIQPKANGAGQRRGTIQLHFLDGLVSLNFSPDGKYLACLGAVEGAIYSTADLERAAGFTGESFTPPTAVAFAPRGSLAALPLLQQSRVRLWDWMAGEETASLEEPQPVREAFFAADGKFLFTHGSRHARIYRLDLATEMVSLGRHAGGTPGLAFSPDGSALASIGKDRLLCVRDSWTGRLLARPGTLNKPGQSVAYAPDPRFLVTGGIETAPTWVWDVISGKSLGQFSAGDGGVVWSVGFSPDGKFFATALADNATNGGIRIYSVQTVPGEKDGCGLRPKQINAFYGSCWSLSFASSNRRLAFADHSARGNLFVWDFCEAPVPRLVATNRISYVQCESFTPDGRQLLYINERREVVALDAATGEKTFSFPTAASRGAGKSGLVNLCLSPDGTELALSSPSRLGVDLWNPKTGRLLASLPEQNGTVWFLAWSPDSQRLAISRSTGEITIWNLKEVERVFAQLGLRP